MARQKKRKQLKIMEAFLNNIPICCWALFTVVVTITIFLLTGGLHA